MKNTFTLILTALLAVSCSGEKSYTINGTAPDATFDGQWVYLLDYNKGLLDSTMIADSRFTFTGVVDTTIMARMDLTQQYFANVFLEKGTITVDMSDFHKIGGTPMNEKLALYLNGVRSISEQYEQEERRINTDISIDRETRVRLIGENKDILFQRVDSICTVYFHPNRNNTLGEFIFRDWYGILSIEKFDSIYAEAGDIIKNSQMVQIMVKDHERKKKTAVGAKFIDFTIEHGNIDSSSVSFSDYIGKGKYVLVDFWASWCKPCLEEVPNIAKVYEKYKGEKFEVLGVAVWDERNATLNAIDAHKMTWPQIIDAETIPMEIYGISGVPHIILFGPDGTILARDLRGQKLRKTIDDIMMGDSANGSKGIS